MYVKQISVFLENRAGSLAGVTRLLGENGFDLMSLSIADTTDFGILRGIVADYKKAQTVLQDAGYSVKVSDVLCVSVPDHPGALANVLSILSENGIGLEYLYSFFRSPPRSCFDHYAGGQAGRRCKSPWRCRHLHAVARGFANGLTPYFVKP